MALTEIKELYVEEITLLRRIRKYVKENSLGNLAREENVRLLLLWRIFSNLYSVSLLTAVALKKGKVSFYQLPIGIILRCCYTDCLFALYIQSAGKERVNEELDLRVIEYANSLLERKEVYRDQVRSVGVGLDDNLIDHMWELTVEDNYLGLLTFGDNIEGLAVAKQTTQQLKNSGFLKTKSISTKDIMNYLSEIPDLKETATKLYHYYRYFSQYEHFSENGQGDVVESFKEDGNDNIHFPSAIKALSTGVEIVMNNSV